MLASISHDLQTPMTRMRLRIEHMKDKAMREHILHDWYAMRNLVDEGLRLARAAYEKETNLLVDLDSLIDTVVTDATDSGQDVIYAQRSKLQLSLAPNSIGRCLANLVNNAAIHGGSAELRVEESARTVTIRVLDNGPGIAQDQLDAVMRPFFQARDCKKGSGLGLSIAKLLAENNGVQLKLSNRSSGGLEARLIIARD